jgi:predicted RNA binding protein YcfA (HicA-like mRNA interferase family)
VAGTPRLSGESLARALERAGFARVKQRSSHLKLRHAETGRICVLPLHRELAVGTLASVLRQAGLQPEDLRHPLDPKADWPPAGHPWPPAASGPWPPR